MKVLAIVASARKTGNSEIVAKEILAALPESTEKKMIRLVDFNIEPCRACYACLPAGKGCIIQDDLDGLLRQVREADAVILASPVYFLGMHTRLKLLCDRCISVLNDATEYSGRRCVVVVPFGVEGWEGYGVEATVSVARFLHLDVVGVLPIHAANPGEAARPEILEQARALAGLLVTERTDAVGPKNGSVIRQTTNSDDIVCSACGSGIVRLSCNGSVRCVICGAVGAIHAMEASGGDAVQCEWDRPEHFRYSVEGMMEHGRRLEDIKADFIARRQELAELRKPYKGD